VYPLQPVLSEWQAPEKRRGEAQRMYRRAKVVDETGQGQLPGPRATAHLIVGFEDGYGTPVSGELYGGGEAVGSRPHHHGVVGMGYAHVLRILRSHAVSVPGAIGRERSPRFSGEYTSIPCHRITLRCCTRARLAVGELILGLCFACKKAFFRVEPRGFEPLTSAVQRRRVDTVVVRGCYENRSNSAISG
jgi:hypothetical protein